MTVRVDVPGLDVLVEKAGRISGAAGKMRVTPLFGDGSDRRFFRIFSGRSSLIGLVSPRVKTDSTDENDSYFLIGNHLFSKRLPVPQILYADTREGRFLLQDAGDVHLQTFVRSRRPRIEPIYTHVVAMLGALHRRAPEGFEPKFCFDSSLYDPSFVYERELEYFRKYFLNGFLGLEIHADELRADFESLAEAAGVSQSSLVFHRDFQSRNIMVCRARLWLLDFQGMRFGPPAYDLASLLIDPYVNVPERLRDKLVSKYWSSTGKFLGLSKAGFISKFMAVKLARNLQILGAFGFLGTVKGKRQFLSFIPSALEKLDRHFRKDGEMRFPRIEKLVSSIRARGMNQGR
jgi:hypothetical protein